MQYIAWTCSRNVYFHNSNALVFRFIYLQVLLVLHSSSFKRLSLKMISAEWLRWLISLSSLIIRSSHRCGWCGFEPHTGHMWDVKFCLRCVRWFSRGTPISPHQLIGSSRYEWNNLERDVKLKKKKKKNWRWSQHSSCCSPYEVISKARSKHLWPRSHCSCGSSLIRV